MANGVAPFQNQYRPRACKAGKLESFGVDFSASIFLDEGSENIEPFKATSGLVYIGPTSPIQFQDMIIQFEGFLTMPFAKKFTGSILGVRQSIVGHNKPEPGGFQISPINCVIFPNVQALYTIGEPERYPFSLNPLLPNLLLPRPHDYSGCTLTYRLAVYMRAPSGLYVEVCERIIPNFGGYNNLSYHPVTAKPGYMEVETKKSLHRSHVQFATAAFSIPQSGYLPGEIIPFTIDFKCHFNVQLECYVQLKASIKIGVFFEGNGVWQTKTMKTSSPHRKLTWTEKLEVPPDSAPCCYGHPMFTTSNRIEFKVILIGYEVVTGSVPIYIGTTRQYPGQSDAPVPGTSRGNSMEVLPVAIPGHSRACPSPSPSTSTSIRSLPPPYSLLSSRAQSMETLPPGYDELSLSGMDGFRSRSHSSIPELSPTLTTEEGDMVLDEQRRATWIAFLQNCADAQANL